MANSKKKRSSSSTGHRSHSGSSSATHHSHSGSSSTGHRSHSASSLTKSHSHSSRHTHDSREKSRMVISYLFAFILSMFLLLGTVCLAALNSLFSESFFCSVIGDDYYESVLDELVTDAEDYTLPVGWDISVLEGAFTLEDVKRDVNSHVTAAFRGYDFKPNLESENSRLYANVSAYLAQENVAVEGDADDAIAAYIEDIDQIYLGRVTMPGMALIKVARDKVKGGVTAALIVLFALSLVLTVTLLRLYRYPHQGMRFVAYATGGCTLMSFMVPYGLYLSKVYEHVLVTPVYFYLFVSNYLKQILFSFMKASLVWLLVTIGCVVFVYLSKNGKLRGRLTKAFEKKMRSLTTRR